MATESRLARMCRGCANAMIYEDRIVACALARVMELDRQTRSENGSCEDAISGDGKRTVRVSTDRRKKLWKWRNSV